MAITTTGLLIAGLVASAVGGGVAAYSSYQQGKAQQRLNNYNAAVNDQAALDRERDARVAANAQRAQAQRLMARQRALWAKAGVVGSAGTPLLVQAEQAGQLELGALETERTGNVQAGQLRQQAVIDRMAGKAARTAGNLNAAATILQTAGSVSSSAAYGKHQGII